MKHVVTYMTVTMFFAVISLAHYHVRFETGVTIICSLASVGVIILGIFSQLPATKGKNKPPSGQ